MRVHAGTEAYRAATELQTRACTLGSHVVFAREETRGVNAGDKVAIAEENLLGAPAQQRLMEPSSMRGYAVGYSTSSHEFAHGLHVNILSSADRATITGSDEKGSC